MTEPRDDAKLQPAHDTLDDIEVSSIRGTITLLEMGIPQKEESALRAVQKLTGGTFVNLRDREAPGRLGRMLEDYLQNKHQPKSR